MNKKAIFIKGFFIFTLAFILLTSLVLAKNFIIENSSDAGQTYFSVNGTSGNVGIGTTSPTQKLHIEGNINITGDLILGGINLSAGGGSIIESGNNSNGYYVKYADGTMIAWGSGSKSTLNAIANRLGTTAGSTYYASDSVTFPINFSFIPQVVIVSKSSAVGYRANTGAVTISGFGAVLESGSVNAGTVSYDWYAIGKWTNLNLGNGIGGSSGIVNTIENENGTCIQFSNGVMDCFGLATVNISITILSNGMYRNSGGYFLFEYPAEFSSTPKLTATGYETSVQSVSIQGSTNVTHGSFLLWSGVSVAATERTVYYRAIGKWTNSTNVNTPDISTWGIDGNGNVVLVNSSRSVNITGNLTLGEKITFAFGEIIDNIKNGWIRITGGLEVDGSINISGANGALIFPDGTNMTSASAGGIWTNVSGTATYEGNVNITGNLTLGGEVTNQNTSRVRVYRDTTQSFPSSVQTIVQYNETDFDTLGEYNSSYQFVAQETGYYSVSARLMTTSVAWDAGEVWFIMLNKNGILYSRGQRNVADAAVTTYRSSMLNDIIYLTAGDYIDISAWHNQGATVDNQADSAYNYFSVMRLNSPITIGGSSGTDGIWTNVSGTATYEGNVNITGNITLGEKITFAFGEVIDNIKDGWIRITGGLEVDGSNVLFKSGVSGSNNLLTLDAEGTSTENNIYFQEDSVDKWSIGIIDSTQEFRIVDRFNGFAPFRIEQGALVNSLYINSNGNVGIGMSSPISRLDINGSFRVQNSSGTLALYVNDSTSNVGIGTNSPSGKLTIGSGQIFVPSIGSSVAPSYSFTGDTNTGMYQSQTSTLMFSVDNVEKARFNANGFRLQTGSAANPSLADTPSGSYGIYFPSSAIGFSANGVEAMRIISSGNVGIGTNNPNSKLEINGSVAIAIKTINNSRTLDDTDFVIIANATSVNITLTLPTAIGVSGRQYTIKKVDSSANKIIIDAYSTQTIDLNLNLNITTQLESYDIISDGSNWWVI